MGLLSGLASFGLGGLENAKLFEEEKKEENKKQAVVKLEKKLEEADFVFEKTYKCPCCDEEFKSLTVRNGKAKFVKSDMDLRPNYEGIDMMKYDPVLCPHCGYTALARYFNYLTSGQVKAVKESISAKFIPKVYANGTYTSEESLKRYQMALVSCIVKKAKNSEKAYTCLRAGWLLRGMLESLDESDKEYPLKKREYTQLEKEYMENAYEGLLAARQTEIFPICGMDKATVDYIMAVLSMRFEKYEVSAELLSGIIDSRTAKKPLKDKALEVKELLKEKMN